MAGLKWCDYTSKFLALFPQFNKLNFYFFQLFSADYPT